MLFRSGYDLGVSEEETDAVKNSGENKEEKTPPVDAEDKTDG